MGGFGSGGVGSGFALLWLLACGAFWEIPPPPKKKKKTFKRPLYQPETLLRLNTWRCKFEFRPLEASTPRPALRV